MAAKTRFVDNLGDHDGDNPANWTAGLPRADYDARIAAVTACHFSQGYTCLSLMSESSATTVTFNGGNWTFTDGLRLQSGTIFVTDNMVVDGSLYVGNVPGSDLSRLSVRFTQARNMEISGAGIPIDAVVWTSPNAACWAQISGLNCDLFDTDGEVRFGSGTAVTVRNCLTIRPGAIVKAAGTNPVFSIQGDIRAEPGTYTWLAGTGGCRFTGTGDQTLHLGNVEGTFDPVIIEKPAGRLFLENDLVCQSLEHRSGILDPGGKSITTIGDCRIRPGARLADSLNGSAWSVGGSLDWQGQDGDQLVLHGDSPWTLSAMGVATVRYTDVAFCDARGGNVINALDGTSINGGNNLNWLFPPRQPIAVAAGCVQSPGTVAGIPIVPTAVAGEMFVAAAETGVVHA